MIPSVMPGDQVFFLSLSPYHSFFMPEMPTFAAYTEYASMEKLTSKMPEIKNISGCKSLKRMNS